MNRRVVLGVLGTAFSAWPQGPGRGLVIILIGPPGAGKSTHAASISRKYNVPVLDVDTVKLKPGMSIDDAVAARVRGMDTRKGLILDGYPRTIAQADRLNVLLNELKLPDPIVVQLDVPDDVARRRAERQRGRDMVKFETELAEYHRELEFARKRYPEADLWTVNGNRNSPQEVFATIDALLRDRQGR